MGKRWLACLWAAILTTFRTTNFAIFCPKIANELKKGISKKKSLMSSSVFWYTKQFFTFSSLWTNSFAESCWPTMYNEHFTAYNIMTPRQIPLLPSVSWPGSIIRQLRKDVHFALCIIKSSTTRSYWALFLGRWLPFLFILYNIMTLVCLLVDCMRCGEYFVRTAFWSMDMTGVCACLCEALCDVITVPSHLKNLFA